MSYQKNGYLYVNYVINDMKRKKVKCGSCGKDVEQLKGKRPKKFCNDNCRNAAHRKKVSKLLKSIK